MWYSVLQCEPHTATFTAIAVCAVQCVAVHVAGWCRGSDVRCIAPCVTVCVAGCVVGCVQVCVAVFYSALPCVAKGVAGCIALCVVHARSLSS